MLNKIIAWYAGTKLAAVVNVAQDFLQHKKCYLLGLAAICHGVSGLIPELLALQGVDAWVGFVRHLNLDPNALEIWGGLSMFAVKSAIVKSGPAELETPPGTQDGPPPA